MNPLLIYLLIYLGTVFYVTAAYYHLKMEQWSFLKAFAIALPAVIIEYQFSLRGNRLANRQLGLHPLQVLIVTMCFYFINLWILNHIVLKQKTNLPRDLTAFVLVICAFLLMVKGSKRPW